MTARWFTCSGMLSEVYAERQLPAEDVFHHEYFSAAAEYAEDFARRGRIEHGDEIEVSVHLRREDATSETERTEVRVYPLKIRRVFSAEIAGEQRTEKRA